MTYVVLVLTTKMVVKGNGQLYQTAFKTTCKCIPNSKTAYINMWKNVKLNIIV